MPRIASVTTAVTVPDSDPFSSSTILEEYTNPQVLRSIVLKCLGQLGCFLAFILCIVVGDYANRHPWIYVLVCVAILSFLLLEFLYLIKYIPATVLLVEDNQGRFAYEFYNYNDNLIGGEGIPLSSVACVGDPVVDDCQAKLYCSPPGKSVYLAWTHDALVAKKDKMTLLGCRCCLRPSPYWIVGLPGDAGRFAEDFQKYKPEFEIGSVRMPEAVPPPGEAFRLQNESTSETV